MADLTRIPTVEGVLWLASVRDAFSNKIVGWDCGPRATTKLVLSALDYALWSREVRAGQLICHSDKGCQYTSLRFTQRLVDAGVAPSTGSVGDSYDNALAENLWSTLKVELIYWPATTFTTRAESAVSVIPLHRRMVQPPPYPSRTQRALARKVRGYLARPAASPTTGYPPTRGRRIQIEKSPEKRGNHTTGMPPMNESILF